MAESLHFHADLYRRDALELAAEKYNGRVRVELADSGDHLVARLEPLATAAGLAALRHEFCTDVFSETARRLRDQTAERPGGTPPARDGDTPPWELLAPLGEGEELGLGWVLESLGPVRSGAAAMVLRHAEHGIARIAIRRNGGAPLGVAHTDHLDFLLMNGGGGTTQTDGSIGRVLNALAAFLRSCGTTAADDIVAALLPHSECRSSQAGANGADASESKRADAPRRAIPDIDLEEGTISFDLEEAGLSRIALYDTVLAFADRCYVFLTRPEPKRIAVHVTPRAETSPDGIAALAAEVTRALNQVLRNAVAGSAPNLGDRSDGLPVLPRRHVDVEGLLAELDAADATTLGVGFQPERGPGHENLRVMNILGTGACNSDCLFCCEKFNPSNRLMPSADATRQMILDADGEFDMLFFASGEPTIHPKLFDYVELAKSVGFTGFGMSSHFRTFKDPRFTLKILQAGFEFFDISLHAADIAGQLDVNPIEDGGDSLYEALKGLAILYRLADALGIRISITHKIVVSRLNVTQLEQVFRATYDRGVRHFILQPVRTLGLAPERQAALAISEDEIMPHLNELLRKTEGLGAMLKPYGFARQALFAGEHIEYERNRIKNVSGKPKAKRPSGRIALPKEQGPRPTDGRHWIELRTPSDERWSYAAHGDAPLLDQALSQAAHLPFGCRMGSCGMCCGVLVSGQVDQSTQHFLSEEQMRQGYVLLCQARPLSDITIRMCSDDEIDPL